MGTSQRQCGPVSFQALAATQLNLPVNDDPGRLGDSQDPAVLAEGGAFGEALPALAARFPRCHDASFTRARPVRDAGSEPAKEHRGLIEAVSVRVVGGGVAGRTVERGPHELGGH